MIDESDSEDPEDENPNVTVTSFSLGRFCAARSQIFHRLSHWNVGQHLVNLVPNTDNCLVSLIPDII
jgi:hypothetical protein